MVDVLVPAGRSVQAETLEARRDLLEHKVLPTLSEPVRYLANLDAQLSDVIAAVRAQGFEVSSRSAATGDTNPACARASGRRWVNRGQEFVIGGYTVGARTFDALVFGYYEGDRLIYAARTRNGFTPALRALLMKRFAALAMCECPLANLPEAKSDRWGAGLTKAKMKNCRWLAAGARGPSV